MSSHVIGLSQEPSISNSNLHTDNNQSQQPNSTPVNEQPSEVFNPESSPQPEIAPTSANNGSRRCNLNSTSSVVSAGIFSVYALCNETPENTTNPSCSETQPSSLVTSNNLPTVLLLDEASATECAKDEESDDNDMASDAALVIVEEETEPTTESVKSEDLKEENIVSPPNQLKMDNCIDSKEPESLADRGKVAISKAKTTAKPKKPRVRRPAPQIEKVTEPQPRQQGVKRRRVQSRKSGKKANLGSQDVGMESEDISDTSGLSGGRLLMTIKRFSSANTDMYRVESTTAVPPAGQGSQSSTTAASGTDDLTEVDSAHDVNNPNTDSQSTSPLPKIRIKTSLFQTQQPIEERLSKKGVERSVQEFRNLPQVTRCELADGRVFEVGNIVWAKIQGYPYWPSRIVRIAEKRVSPTCAGVAFSSSTATRKPLTKAQCRSSVVSHPQGNGDAVVEFWCCIDWLAWNQCSYLACDKLFHFQEAYEQKYSAKIKSKLYINAVKEAKEILADAPIPTNAKKTKTPATVPSKDSLPAVPPSRLAEFLPLKVRIPLNLLASVAPPQSYPLPIPPPQPSIASSYVPHAPSSWTAPPPPSSVNLLPSTTSQPPLAATVPSSHLWHLPPSQTSTSMDDLPVLSGQLFGEAHPSGVDIPEFSDDEEINFRKNITGTVINL